MDELVCAMSACSRFSRAAKFRLIVLSIGIGISGCGGADEDLPKTVTVSGMVTVNGEILKEGTVMFHPQGGPGHPATGEIGENGIYTLSTFDANDGAVVGNHIVTVQIFPKGANPGFEEEAADVKVPKKYTSAATSDLLVTVNEGANNIGLDLTDE